MYHSGKLFRAEIYADNKYPYTNVKQVYEANKNRYPTKRLCVMNSHWWDSKAQFVGNLKVNGKILSHDWGADIGFFWSGNDTPKFDWCDMKTEDNFLSTIPVIHNGKVLQSKIDAQTSSVKRSVPRTWWGFDKSGNSHFEVTTSFYTLQQIVNRMKSLGVVNGIVLDGSGSSQYYDGQTHIKGTDGRTVYCFLLLWYDEEPIIEKCPYAEPTQNIKYGSRGEGAKWVQYMLNQHGAKLTVDGIIGSLSVSAIKVFQSKNGLVADGICGKLTRTKLKLSKT